ncbi:MAG: dynamin family protein [Romboutsia sp.]
MYISREEEYLKLTNILNLIDGNLENINCFIKRDDKLVDNKCIKIANYINSRIVLNRKSIEELRDPFTLFIVGGGNYGKSTLINALLEENIIKTRDLPNTWKVDLFIKNNIEKVEITYRNNEKITMTIKEGNEILKKEEEKYKESKKSISKKIREVKNSMIYGVEDLKKYKKKLEALYLYKINIIEVKYFLKRGKILNDFTIVDTPGLNQNLINNIEDRVNGYYLRADGVIWLIDSQNIVSKENHEIIKEINDLDKLYCQDKNIIGVVNKIDIIEKYNDNSVEKLKAKAGEIYKDYFKEVIFISAKKAIDGIVSDNKDLIEESNIKTLYKSIEKNFKDISESNQIKSKYKNLYIMKAEIIKEMNLYKRELYKDMSKYNQSEFQLKEKIKNLKLYVSDYIEKLKTKNYIFEDIEIKGLSDDFKSLEEFLNVSLERMYLDLYSISNFNKNKSIIDTSNLKIIICTSKSLVNDYKIKELLMNHKYNLEKEDIFSMLRIDKSVYEDKFFMKNIALNRIKILEKEIYELLDEKLKYIEFNINNIREVSFKELYIDYKDIKTHVNYIYNIEKILERICG